MRIALMASVSMLAGMAQADAPKVVADIAPVHALVARVMDGVGEPEILVEQGASPHHYALRPSKAGALSNADAVFWVSAKLEPWLEGSLDNLAKDARIIELMEVPGTTKLAFREGAVFGQMDHDDHGHEDEDHDGDDHADHGHEGHDHEEHDHEGHDKDDHGHETHDDDDHADHGKADQGHDDHGHDDHGHAHTGMDPHGWLDPMNAQVWMGVIAEELARIDPENAERYKANAAAGTGELYALTGELYASLTEFQNTPFVVFHDAYRYFENRFGLSASGAISLSDASEPGAKRIAEVRATVNEHNITCVFAEPQFDPGLIAAVAEEGATVSTLDPLGTDLELGWSLYPQLLRNLASNMLVCNGA